MADLHVHRPHTLGLEAARKLAHKWAAMAREKLEMQCECTSTPGSEEVHFSRSGVSGRFKATADAFEVSAKLGLLFKPFRSKFQQETAERLEKAIEAEAKKRGHSGI